VIQLLYFQGTMNVFVFSKSIFLSVYLNKRFFRTELMWKLQQSFDI